MGYAAEIFGIFYSQWDYQMVFQEFKNNWLDMNLMNFAGMTLMYFIDRGVGCFWIAHPSIQRDKAYLIGNLA